MRLAAVTPDAAGRVTVYAADAAVQQGDAGRACLPEALHADFDRVVLAFRQAEAGQDDDARATLQAIGLRSPFLEWRVLLRGLQAYYARDDARALENWQRLAPDRLPARLAAPFRFQIDPEFRAAQPPETQAALQRQLDRVEGGVALLPQLRQVRAALANQDTLAVAVPPRRGAAAGPAPRGAAGRRSAGGLLLLGGRGHRAGGRDARTSASSAGRPPTRTSTAWRRWPTSGRQPGRGPQELAKVRKRDRRRPEGVAGGPGRPRPRPRSGCAWAATPPPSPARKRSPGCPRICGTTRTGRGR